MSNAAVFAAGLASIVLDSARQFATVRAGDLKHDPRWIRQDAGSKEEQIALARSYLANPINYILITPDGVVRDGNRRLCGILANSGPEAQVPVCITSEEITSAVSLEIMLESAEHTKALTPYEKYVGYSEWMKLTGSAATELARKAHLSDSMVSRILSLSRGNSDVIEAARLGLIDPNLWAMIVQSPDQSETLRLFTSGQIKNRAEMAVAVKRSQKPDADTSPVKSMLIAMPEQRRVVLKGSVNLSTAREILTTALRLVEKAEADGLSARSAQAMWKDTSKKPRPPRRKRQKPSTI